MKNPNAYSVRGPYFSDGTASYECSSETERVPFVNLADYLAKMNPSLRKMHRLNSVGNNGPTGAD